MRITHKLVPFANMDRFGPNQNTKMNFRLERGEVEGRLRDAKQTLEEAKAEAGPGEVGEDRRVAYYKDEVERLEGFIRKIDEAGGSYVYMPQKFIDKFNGISEPARALAVDLAMLTGKLDGDLTSAEVHKVMQQEHGNNDAPDAAWHRALYGEILAALAAANETARVPRPAGVPSGGNPLSTRIQNMTAPVVTSGRDDVQAAALASIAGKVPRADAIEANIPGTLLKLIGERLDEARAKDRSRAMISPDELNAIFNAPPGTSKAELLQGYAAIAQALTSLGYQAESASDIGVRFQAIVNQNTAPPSKAAFLAALDGALPAPPGAGAARPDLGALIQAKIQDAVATGKHEASLSPSEIWRAFPADYDIPLQAYKSLAQALDKLGYECSADRYDGISISWDAPEANPMAPEQLSKKILSDLPPAQRDPAQALGDLVTTRIEAAQRRGRTDFDLTHQDLDRLVGPVFGNRLEGYEAIAEALKKKGFEAFADGFIGVNAGWQD